MANENRHTIEGVCTAIRQARGMKTIAAQILGVNRSTIHRYVDRYPEVAQAVEDAKSLTLDLAENKLYERMMAGDSWAVCFLLKTQGKHRGYVERQEHTGQNGTALQAQHETMQTLDLTKLSVKQLEALHELLSLAATGNDANPDDALIREVSPNAGNGGPPTGKLLPSPLH